LFFNRETLENNIFFNNRMRPELIAR